MSNITPGVQKGVISRISVENNTNGKRFVLSIMVAAVMAQTKARQLAASLHRDIEGMTFEIKARNPEAVELIMTDEEKAKLQGLQDHLKDVQLNLPNLKDEPTHYEYFSTPLSSAESVRINAQQLRNAFPELMGVNPDEAVFMKMLTQRSRFVNREINFTVTPQIDKVTKAPKLDAKNRPYTNVRIEASSEDISEQDALAMLSGTIATAAVNANAGTVPEDHGAPDDIPM